VNASQRLSGDDNVNALVRRIVEVWIMVSKYEQGAQRRTLAMLQVMRVAGAEGEDTQDLRVMLSRMTQVDHLKH
jgi:hypothetical protein